MTLKKIFLFAFIFSLTNPVFARLKIEITQGQVAATPIAIPSFFGAGDLDSVGDNMATVISNDLESSGLFSLINKGAYVQDSASLQHGPRFSDWRVLKAPFLLTGNITHESGGKIKINFRLFDVFSGTQMLGLSFSGEQVKWRKIAHMISDAVYKRVTGEAGYFDTQVVFIDESGPQGKGRIKKLAIMDLDGENLKYLTDGKNLVLTPRYSPSKQEIAYLAFIKKTAHVYTMNLQTGKKSLLGNFEGMTFAPHFSPDGKSIIMSLAKNGTTAIYTQPLPSGKPTPLTQHLWIDTSPCYSPDGSQIVFNSDRSGTSQVYVMDKNGGNVKRISFGDGKYSQPVWSPRSDLIAFTKQTGGKFYIGVMSPDGSGERLIADGFLVEGSVWASNGRYLMFTKETSPNKNGLGGTSRLFFVDLTGRNMRPIKTPRDASDCAWSPLANSPPG